MAERYTALRLESLAWTLSLTTAKDPAAQLASLHRVLHRPMDQALRAFVEGRPPLPNDPERVPTVFEDTAYTLTLVPRSGWQILAVHHPLRQDVADSLERVEGAPGLWHGTVNTGNDIGWFPLEIVLEPEDRGPTQIDKIAWQVWPTKLDYGSDLRAMTLKIEEVYPLWLFRFHAATVHDVGSSTRQNDAFLLMWFTQFDRLWARWEKGIQNVIRSPHMRLEGQMTTLRADRLKGRLGGRLEAKVLAGRSQPERRYSVEQWRSSRDTVENRFILHVILKSLAGLERFLSAVDGPGLSLSFR